MYYDRKFLQTSAGQIGVLCVAAGFAKGFFVADAWISALSLSIVGIVLIFLGSIRREVK